MTIKRSATLICDWCGEIQAFNENVNDQVINRVSAQSGWIKTHDEFGVSMTDGDKCSDCVHEENNNAASVSSASTASIRQGYARSVRS